MTATEVRSLPAIVDVVTAAEVLGIGRTVAYELVRTMLGHKNLQDVTKADVEALVTSMLTAGGRTGQGRSPRTVTMMLVVL